MATKELKNFDWDQIFRKKLYSVFHETKNIFLNNLGEQETVQELERLANSFYNEFKDSPLPIDPPEPELYYSKKYVSASINLPYSCFMVPYFFYSAFLENINFDLEAEFSVNLPWSELLGIINQKWLTQRKKLTKTDVLICKVLSRYNVQGQLFKFPLTHNIIANRTRKDLTSIKKTFPTLGMRVIASEFFLLNPWKLGWEIYLCVYERSMDFNFNDFNSLTISKEILNSNIVFRVIQLPMIELDQHLHEIKSQCKISHGRYYFVDSLTFNWDLSQLESNENKSFSTIPEFFTTKLESITPNVIFSYEENASNWLDDLSNVINGILKDDILEDSKTDSKSVPLAINEEKKEKIIRILNFLIDYGIILNNFETTAKKLGLSDKELSNIIQYLIKRKIITLGHRFQFIGAGMEYAFIIENATSELQKFIKESLLQCPFSYFYENEGLLAGRVQIPNNWLYKVIEFFTRLQLQNKDISINYGQRLLGYNFFNPNVKLPKNFLLNEFGMKEALE